MCEAYELVRLPNGSFSIRSRADGEIFHPVAGPIAEAEALYVRQLRLHERMILPHNVLDGPHEFVIWDVGLGAGGNALTTIRQLAHVDTQLRLVSFDRTIEALSAALRHSRDLQFPLGFEETIEKLIANGKVEFTQGKLHVDWEVKLGDFPWLLTNVGTGAAFLPKPHAIFFDAFSPARNADMWTKSLFQNLFRALDPRRPCSLATFSRSTMARVSMLLAGFFVGIGEAVAGKEETTIAANALALIEQPLDLAWFRRAAISRSAEPLTSGVYRQAPISETTYERLRAHPQFTR